MASMHFIGLDIHKKANHLLHKGSAWTVLREGTVATTRQRLDVWMRSLPQPWTVAMEATLFTSWIYDYLLPHAAAVKVAHPLMLRAIAAAKKKNDRIDAARIADCLRCDFLRGIHGTSSNSAASADTALSQASYPPERTTRKTTIAQMLMEIRRELQQAEAASAGLLPSGAA